LKSDLCADRLRQLLDYNADTGIFRWKASRGRARAGSVAGYLDSRGYRRIKVDGRHYAHRLAYLWLHGVWPPDQIDHINIIPAENRAENLRPCNQSQNQANKRCGRDSISGLKGAYRHYHKWKSWITKDGRRIHLGTFATAEEAHAAYCAKGKELFGEFFRAD
jgi:hypothetical protein